MVALGMNTASGENYPSRPVRLLAAAIGGGVDFAARVAADGLTNVMGMQFIVDNRGGTVIIPAKIVADATPDGYTLLVYSNNFWVLPLIQRDVPYDPIKDFSAVTAITSTPNLLVVHPSVPVNSVKELIALAKAKPGQLNYASGPNGASNHLAGELFKFMAGVDIVRVAYKGSGPAVLAILGGEVHMMITQSSTVGSSIKSGRLRVLGVTTLNPSPLFPDLPTLAASGLPGFEIASLNAIFAPAGTPKAIINQLNESMAKALSTVEMKRRLSNVGSEPAAGRSPEQFAAYVKADMVRLAKIFESAGIRRE